MSFHQYKLIKKLTKFISLFCAAFVVMGSTALFAIQSIKADETCGTLTITAVTTKSSIDLGDSFEYILSDNSVNGSLVFYQYSVQATDVKTNQTYEKEVGTINGRKEMSIKFDSGGEKSFFVTYTNAYGSGCSQGKTNVINVKVVDKLTSSPNIWLGTTSDKFELGSSVFIYADVPGIYNSDGSKNTDNMKVRISIDDSIKTECAFSFETKCDYLWNTTTSESTLGTKKIKAKIFNLDTGAQTDGQSINVTLCPVGGLATCSATTTEDGAGGGTTATPAPTVSVNDNETVNIGNQAISFVLNRGSGIGGLITFIINLLISLIGGFAFISFMVAGIQYITAGGDSAKTGKAKKTMIYAGVSMVLVTFSLVIIHLVNNEIAK